MRLIMLFHTWDKHSLQEEVVMMSQQLPCSGSGRNEAVPCLGLGFTLTTTLPGSIISRLVFNITIGSRASTSSPTVIEIPRKPCLTSGFGHAESGVVTKRIVLCSITDLIAERRTRLDNAEPFAQVVACESFHKPAEIPQRGISSFHSQY